MRIAVLGCGPTGLLVAHAVEQAGHTPVILSRKQKSFIPGILYLHDAIPGLTGVYPDNHVQYVRMGTAEGYAQKVYGDAERNTGWENYLQIDKAWNAILAYDKLWERYEDQIVDREILPWDLREMIYQYDKVITTLPVWATCVDDKQHGWFGSDYWIKPLPVPPMDANRDILVYNGLPQDKWYRWSVTGGKCSIESTVPGYLTGENVIQGVKATSTNCDCWVQAGVERAGRWAEWRHGVLLNHAYQKAVDIMEGL